MARRTGIFVQMQRDFARQQRERQRAEAAYVRQQQQAHREALRTAAAERRYAEQLAKADARARTEMEKQRKLAHVESQQALVDQYNADLTATVAEMESLLAATLEVDDYVDFESLKRTTVHPPFQPGALAQAVARPVMERLPARPVFEQFAPQAPTGLSKLFSGKSYERDLAGAQRQFAFADQQWQQHVAAAQQRQAQADHQHKLAEQERLARLAAAEQAYQAECQARVQKTDEHNAEVDGFAEAFRAGEPQAIVDYFTLVLANSDYPDSFPQRYRIAYVPESKQLVIEYELPTIDCVPTEREFRYVKSKDEITSVARPAKDIKVLYASIVAQVTLRTVHEVFEADRLKMIDSLVFNAVVSTIDKGTGNEISPCLVTLRTTNDVFDGFNLHMVEPLECLNRLNAAVSKKPDELAPVRPVLEFDMVDKRFIEETDVLSSLDSRPNLLELSPTEFESLIQNLFAKMGLDTKQTRPSRDGGVDCVAFDPRPIFGGKVVIQAKRYRNTVDVSAVRDLYGTLQNEGASKGILVTTSGYGKASFEFASGKPLELIDGANLLYLLAEHADLQAKIVAPEK
ncbi:restriction endonuclease [Lentzea sp. NPDC058450]|uniref:restriction endonuclease n=1 Tax=Lentzea sp. NPDC058450 TaxID=3346505 RepID=UPI003653E91D